MILLFKGILPLVRTFKVKKGSFVQNRPIQPRETKTGIFQKKTIYVTTCSFYTFFPCEN
jgi:hypothetical protein